jgi:NTE family protein
VVPRTGLGKVDEIRIEGVERTNREVLAALIESKPGEALDEVKLNADLRRIYGRGDFEAVNYSIERDNAGGSPALVINVREKEIGPDYLRFGLSLASDFKGDAYFNALVQYRRTWLNRFGADWVAEAQIGQNTYLFTEFYQPVEERGRFFVAPYASYGQYTRGVFVGDDRVAEYQVRQGLGGLDLGAALGTWGEARLGPVWRSIDAYVDTGSPALPDVKVNSSGVRFKLFGDRLDTAYFARSGESLRINAFEALTALGADAGYRRLDAIWSGAYSFGPHTINATLAGGTDFGSGLPPYDAFLLGGPFKLSGYRINQFAGDTAAFAMLRYYNQILRLPSLLGSGIYVGLSAEAGRMNGLYTQGGASTGNLYSGSVYLGAETFLGPAYLGVGFAGGGNTAAYFLLGVPW